MVEELRIAGYPGWAWLAIAERVNSHSDSNFIVDFFVGERRNSRVTDCSIADLQSLMLGSVLTAAGVATAVSAGYQTMSPTGTWFGHALNHLDRASKQIALTFDDGPNDPHTMRLLEVLARHEVQATFFVIGRFAQKRPDIVREIVSAGHVVGNHTFSHPLLTLKSTARIKEEVINCDRALSDALGVHSKLFRPPFGGRRPAVFRIIRELGLEPVMWNVTGYDWNAPSAEHIERKVSAKIRGGDIILLHDGSHVRFGADRSHTVTATDRLITRYKAEEYRFVPLGKKADNGAREGVPSVSHSNS